MSDVMTGDQKLAYVKDQIVPLLTDSTLEPRIDCPYCGGVWASDNCCCPKMAWAAAAIVEAYDLMQRIDMANRIVDKAYAN